MARGRGAQIVLLARPSRNSEFRKFKKDFLSEIYPTDIPRDFVESIDLIFRNGKTISFDCSKLSPNFTMDELTRWLKEIENDSLKTVEVILDIDKIYEVLKTDSEQILSKYFSD